MGWGCYKHEADAGSILWQEKLAEITPDNCYPWGRDGQICPWCHERLTEIETGITFPLADSKETTVGRVDPVTGIKPDIDLTPVDGKRSISRRHARIRRDKGGGFSVIEDVGTMNGTFVNGVRLVAGRGAPVAAGDTVVFGTIQCRFETDGD